MLQTTKKIKQTVFVVAVAIVVVCMFPVQKTYAKEISLGVVVIEKKSHQTINDFDFSSVNIKNEISGKVAGVDSRNENKIIIFFNKVESLLKKYYNYY